MYFAHIGNYMIYYLGFSADMMGYIEGVALVLAMLFTIPCTKLLNNNKAPLLCFISTVLNSLGVGLLGLFVRPENVNTNSIWNPMLLLGVLLLGMGYVLFCRAARSGASSSIPRTREVSLRESVFSSSCSSRWS